MSRGLVTCVYILLLCGTSHSAQRCLPVENCRCKHVKSETLQKMIYIMDCSHQRLTYIPTFNPKNNVDTVRLNNNSISRVLPYAFKNLSVRVVDLSGNNIQVLDADSFLGSGKAIKEINLSGNQLSAIPAEALSKVRSLKRLFLDNNYRISEITPDMFKNFRSLHTLSLRACGIRHLHNRGFRGMRRLRVLDLSQNMVERISGRIRDLKHLEILNISRNKLDKIPSGSLIGMKSLKELYVRHNEISSLPARAFKSLESLRVFDFEGNNYLRNSKDLMALVLTNETLESLNINNCSLREWPTVLSSLSQLKKLDIGRNKIREIPTEAMSNLLSLTTFSIRTNPIVLNSDVFMGLENSLQFIDMRDLGLTSLPNVPLSRLNRLEKVDLRYNIIKHLKKDFFSGVKARVYDMSNNYITGVSNDAFRNISTSKPLTVILRSNKLQNLNFIESSVCLLKVVDVTDNPISCDCSTYNLTMYDTLKLVGHCNGTSHLEEFTDIDLRTNMLRSLGSDLCPDIKLKSCGVRYGVSPDAETLKVGKCRECVDEGYNVTSKSYRLTSPVAIVPVMSIIFALRCI